MPKKIFIIIILVVLAAFAQFARADYHYASHEGSNEYPYTSWETAADSIQLAVDAAEGGDTIYVGAGVWEQCDIQLPEYRALIGMGMDSTIFRIDTTAVIEYIYPYSFSLVESFAFDGVDPEDGLVKALEPAYQDSLITIRNNRFINNRIAITGIYGAMVENNIFDNNHSCFDSPFGNLDFVIRNNTFMNQHVSYMILLPDGVVRIENNVFARNNVIEVISKTNLHNLRDSLIVLNNIFFKNYLHVDFFNIYTTGGKLLAKNNVVVGNNVDRRDGWIETHGNIWDFPYVAINNVVMDCNEAFRIYPISPEYNDTMLLYYNDLWHNEPEFGGNGYYDTVIGNIHIDPMFADTTDFHLQMFSPLIDAGDPAILDVDGSRSDIGLFGGQLGESYEYQDLPPRIPDSLEAMANEDSIIITWRFNTEADFNHYKVFKDTVAGFEPSLLNLIAEPDTSIFVDRDFNIGHNYYYRVAAVDNQANMSAYSAELAVSFTSVDDFSNRVLPSVSTIEHNHPNPFNARTRIGYYLADVGYQPAPVQLYIYNVAGQLVRRLVDERQYPGERTVIWDGRDDGGMALSSGVYFARLTVSGVELSKPRKLVLLK